MKKRFLLLPLFGAFAYVTLSSDSNGPGGNKTGSHGASAGCGSCHGSSATAGVTLSFVLDSAGTPVTRYKPGMTYTLKMTGTNTTSNNLPKYGTQLSMVSGSGSSSVNAGTFSGLPAGTATHTSSGITILEHTQRLSPASGTGSTGTTYEVSVSWTAPAAGTGTVTAWGVINAVNTSPSSDDAGDKWNTGSASFTELPSTTAVANVAVADVNIFPNPVADQLHINGYNGTYMVFDVNGKMVASGTATNNTVIDAANWNAGLYIVKFDGQAAKAIIKK